MHQFVALIILQTAVGINELPERPPVLQFKKNINYRDWWNQQHSRENQKNAFDHYRKLTIGNDGEGERAKLPEAVEKELRSLRLGQPWNAGAHPELATYIETHKKQIDILQQAAALEHSWLSIPDSVDAMIHWPRPEMQAIRLAAKIAVIRSWLDHPNREKRVIDTCMVVFQVADHWYQHGLFMDQFTAAAVESYAFASLRQAWRQNMFDNAEARQFYAKLSNRGDRWDWQAIVQGEWTSCLDSLNFFCPNGVIGSNWGKEVFGALPFDPNQARDIIDRHFMHVRNLFEQRSRRVAHKAVAAYRDRDPFGIKRNYFTSVMITDMRFALNSSLRADSQYRGTMITLALLAHHHQHSQWPDTLEAIDPALGLERLANYRIDPITGAAFVYGVDGKDMTLYSIGFDGNDNDGQHSGWWGERPVERDYVFWPIPD